MNDILPQLPVKSPKNQFISFAYSKLFVLGVSKQNPWQNR